MKRIILLLAAVFLAVSLATGVQGALIGLYSQSMATQVGDPVAQAETLQRDASTGELQDPDRSISEGEYALNEAIGEHQMSDEIKAQTEPVIEEVQSNPVVTDAMREVMEHHGISEDSIPKTAEEANQAILEDPKNLGEEVQMEEGLPELALDTLLDTKTVQARPPNCTNETPVAIYKNTTNATDTDLRSLSSGVDNQLWNDYSLHYHCAFAYYAPTSAQIGSGSVIMFVNNQAPPGSANGGHSCGAAQPYATNYGVHGLTGTGISGVNQFDKDYNSRSISHEVMETLSNPCPDYGFLDQHTGPVSATYVGGPSNDNVAVQKEIADGIGGEHDYLVSAWLDDQRQWKMNPYVFPSWFVPGSQGPWDNRGVTTGPLVPTGTNAIMLYYWPWTAAGNGQWKFCKSFVDPATYCSNQQRLF